MRLDELFLGDEGLPVGGGEMVKHLRSLVLDYLTPLAAHKIEAVTMDDIREVLELDKSGLMIDRNLMMQVLDPDSCRMVKKIDGDTVYISFPVADKADETQEKIDQNINSVKKTAGAEAMKAVKL